MFLCIWAGGHVCILCVRAQGRCLGSSLITLHHKFYIYIYIEAGSLTCTWSLQICSLLSNLLRRHSVSASLLRLQVDHHTSSDFTMVLSIKASPIFTPDKRITWSAIFSVPKTFCLTYFKNYSRLCTTIKSDIFRFSSSLQYIIWIIKNFWKRERNCLHLI